MSDDLSYAYRVSAAALRVHAGPGALSRLADETRRLGARRAFVLCGRSVADKTDLLDHVRAALGDAYAGVYDGVQAESPLPSVEAATVAAGAAEADLLVAIGGGSAVVTARAVAILLGEQGNIRDLCTQYPPGRAPVSPRLNAPKLPIVLVLTTPTTAANRAGAAVLDPERHRRLELFDPKTRPAAIILDPAALLSAPMPLYRNAAVTLFTGLVAALQAPDLNPFGHADLREGLELALRYLPRLVAAPDDADARLALATAALLANRASEASSPRSWNGVASGLVHQLQSRYPHVEQGSASAVLAAHGMRFNRPALAAGQARVARLLGVQAEGMSDDDAAEAAAVAVSDFLASLGMPARLRDLDVPQADIPALATAALSDFFLRSNPRPVEHVQELEDLLRAAW